jgi:hypothetical protein
MKQELLVAFNYVNKHYVFDEKNYPLLGKLTSDEQFIFSLNHGLLHIVKSSYGLNYNPRSQEETSRFEWMTKDDTELGTIARLEKKNLLKMIVNILSLAHTAGITEENIQNFTTPSDEEMLSFFFVKHLGQPIIPTFGDIVEHLIKNLAIILERADHQHAINYDEVYELSRKTFLGIMYWINTPWSHELLKQIPSVMKY